MKIEFKNGSIIDGVESSKAIRGIRSNMLRCYPLNDGTIFQIIHNDLNMFLEYDDEWFYEVVIDGEDIFYQSKYKRTGKVFNGEEINEMVKSN